MLWMDENASQQSNKNSLMMENLQLLNDITTKLARIAPTWGIEAGALNRYPYRPIDAYHLYRGATGSSAHILKFSL